MVTVAVLLLPGLGLLLFAMTYLEDRLFGDPEPPRNARRRHLRLLPGGRGEAPGARRPEEAGEDRPPGRHAA
ncbi:hypothetical protein ACFUAC_07065 [Streptomyces sp. NPDC057148]|uniref:hypothetical protein n=1 Tax=unclassified Streptomyces TaxID=2593676 RepID=UPI00363FB30F